MAIGKTNYPPGGVDTSDATMAVGDLLSGKTGYGSAGTKLTGTMTNVGAQSITPAAAGNTITAGYHNGSGGVAADADFIAGNIKTGINIWGVTGTLNGAPTSIEAETSVSGGGNVTVYYAKFGKLYIFGTSKNFGSFKGFRFVSDAGTRAQLCSVIGITESSYYQSNASGDTLDYASYSGSWTINTASNKVFLEAILAA